LYKDNDDKSVLMDFKSRKLKAIKETHVDLQLRAYTLALESEGKNVDRIVAYPVQEENIDIKNAELSVSESDKAEVKDVVKTFINNVKNENFDGSNTKSHFCAACPYKRICSFNKSRG